jgi:hypothetical protein
MNTVLIDFSIRVQEVDGYFIFLENLIKNTTKLAVLDSYGKYKTQSLSSELEKNSKSKWIFVAL